jgi:hypothetical protein
MGYPVTEIEGQLHQAGQVVLDASGNGVLTFTPGSARQRWVVKSVVVSTNQAATATAVPVATVARNTVTLDTMSQGHNHGQSWSGNQDTFAGAIDVGPCDSLSVLFSLAPGQGASGAGADLFTDLFTDVFGVPTALAGVIGYATVTGTRYTRRA